MQRMEKYASVAPGLLIAAAVTAAARFLEGLFPIHLIGASVIALFIGMGINALRKPSALVAGGPMFTSKRALKLAIILLGASLSMRDILTVGRLSLIVMCFTLLTCFGGGYLVGRSLGLNWKLSNLISAGTGICGGSAIAAIAPVIDAQDRDIAYAMSATFLFDMVMILMFPFLGHWLGMSDMAYGLWAGTAVNDTSSVVAAGYAFSEAAGDFATMVKLTRMLSIIPTVLIFSVINVREKCCMNVAVEGERVNVLTLFPWFILGFLGLALFNSVGLIPAAASAFLKDLASSSWWPRWPLSALTPISVKCKKRAFAPCCTDLSSPRWWWWPCWWKWRWGWCKLSP